MKVKFGLFNWSYSCQLCKHAVCSVCLTKVARFSPLFFFENAKKCNHNFQMRIPSEHFSNIPVFALSPPKQGGGGGGGDGEDCGGDSGGEKVSEFTTSSAVSGRK